MMMTIDKSDLSTKMKKIAKIEFNNLNEESKELQSKLLCTENLFPIFRTNAKIENNFLECHSMC